MARYRVGRSTLIVVKPSGEILRRDVILSYDVQLELFEVTFVGEESALKNHSFGVLQSELKRIRDTGEEMNDLPRATE